VDATSDAMIRLEGVGKRYPDGTVAVHELDLDVPRGELVVLVGPSGCGKSTTLKMVNRLIEPTSGRILLDGEDVTRADPVELRRRMGYVIQQIGLFPHQTVATNVATVPRLLGWDRKRTATRVQELLDLVGLDPGRFAKRYPHQLSGGQRQRVGVARALAADPPVLLMDEPFGAVDPIVRDHLQAEFLRLQKEVRKTILFVTHDLDEAIKLGDRIAVFREGGHLEQYDTPQTILAAPATDFVAEFVGGDRTIKRLSVTPVTSGDVEPLPTDGVDGLPTIPVDRTSLREALAVMLADDRGTVVVVEDGEPIGTLTPAGVHAALRRSIDATRSPSPSPSKIG
jgi:osmoprotectant transport system ATP-binding protein